MYHLKQLKTTTLIKVAFLLYNYAIKLVTGSDNKLKQFFKLRLLLRYFNVSKTRHLKVYILAYVLLHKRYNPNHI